MSDDTFNIVLRDDYGVIHLIEKTSNIDRAKGTARYYEKNLLQAVSLFMDIDSLDVYYQKMRNAPYFSAGMDSINLLKPLRLSKIYVFIA